jgi:uncharacterized membrane protein YdbT with pleckstrin-like domain
LSEILARRRANIDTAITDPDPMTAVQLLQRLAQVRGPDKVVHTLFTPLLSMLLRIAVACLLLLFWLLLLLLVLLLVLLLLLCRIFIRGCVPMLGRATRQCLST